MYFIVEPSFLVRKNKTKQNKTKNKKTNNKNKTKQKSKRGIGTVLLRVYQNQIRPTILRGGNCMLLPHRP